jgi:hypothetical protein
LFSPSVAWLIQVTGNLFWKWCFMPV